MIIGESMEVPRETKKLLRLTTEELLKNYRLRTFHFREDGDGLVTAEGEEMVSSFPGMLIGAVPGHLYIYNIDNKRILERDTDIYFPNVYAPFHLFRFFDKSGNAQTYCVTPTNVLRFLGKETQVVGQNKGGTCAAVFHERIFTANGERVFYSKALDGSVWSESRYGGGFLDLNSDSMGEILGMVPYKDRLYLLRRSGISFLRALGDELNFVVAHMPMKCGSLIAGSTAICGEKIGYFTDSGFYLFNGALSVLAQNSRFAEIDLTKEVKAVSYRGRYYALVTKKEGAKAIYCYNPEWNQAHFIECNPIDIAAGDELYFARRNLVYTISSQGICNEFSPYLTAENIAFGIGEEKILRSIAIEGEGTFSVCITSNRGRRTIKGNAGEELKLRSPLRGNKFNLKISVAIEDADSVRFRALQMYFTEESNDN